MHVLANLLNEYSVMTMQLFQVLGEKKLIVQKLHTQLKLFFTTLNVRSIQNPLENEHPFIAKGLLLSLKTVSCTLSQLSNDEMMN